MLWYMRNKALWDVLRWENNQLWDGNSNSSSSNHFVTLLIIFLTTAHHLNKTLESEMFTLAMRKPSENSMISQICWRSGTMTTTGRNRAFTDSGSSVRPA